MIDTAAVNASVDLRELAGRYTTLRRESVAESSGPCPKCGGTDRLHVKAGGWFCRQCHSEWGDAIEFMQWIHGVDFREAVARLGHVDSERPAHRAVPAVKATVRRPVDWAREALKLAAAQRALQAPWSDVGQPGRDYLEKRGLEPHTWSAFGLGFHGAVHVPGTQEPSRQYAPAIAIPWYRGGRLTGIRYRFLEMQNDHKKTSLSGSEFRGTLFGGQALCGNGEERRTLLLMEGELNALSVWQVAHHTNLDVLSLGSENASITDRMVEHALRWRRVIVWMDKPEKARETMEKLPGAYGVNSLAGKVDANDLLQRGELGGFLCAVRLRACRDDADRERLLWDLWDGANTLDGVDAGTAAMIRHLADAQGKSARVYEPEPGRWLATE